MLEELLKRLRRSRNSISPYQDMMYSDTPGRADPIQQKLNIGGWERSQNRVLSDHDSMQYLLNLAKKYGKTKEEQQLLFNQFMGMDLNSLLNGGMKNQQNRMEQMTPI